MKTAIFFNRVMVLLVAFTATCACAAMRPPVRDYSDRGEQTELERLARDGLGVKIDGAVSGGTDNIIGLRSGSVTFSRRLDSRTYFAHDERYGLDKDGGAFQGPDDQIVRRAREILDELKIPAAEIDASIVRRESTQEAEVSGGRIMMGKPGAGKIFAWVSRRVAGVPVFSSRAVVGLTRGGDIGFMEVHWPQIPDAVVTEALRLDFKVRHGWRPPALEGATVESVQAGVIHSPAVGFLMDIYPVIRVVYAAIDKAFGKRPTLYFNRDGKVVPTPRQFELPCECGKEPGPRGQPPSR
jgi:hypothetical protein